MALLLMAFQENAFVFLMKECQLHPLGGSLPIAHLPEVLRRRTLVDQMTCS